MRVLCLTYEGPESNDWCESKLCFAYFWIEFDLGSTIALSISTDLLSYLCVAQTPRVDHSRFALAQLAQPLMSEYLACA